MKFYLVYILLIAYQIVICQKCVEGQNFCKNCNQLTNLCAICYNNDVLTPDKNGGCEGNKKCEKDKNYCTECDSDGNLCSVCEEGYIPDENGGCTYSNNCEISIEGVCIKCKTDFILIGKTTYNNVYDNLKICKYNKSEEFKNCEVIDYEKGLCRYCKQDYFLTGKDKKCTKVQFCAESKFGVCKECNAGYYLDKLEDKCLQQKRPFLHCKISLDGEKCDECIENYYFDENGECIRSNFCSNEKDYNCEKCNEGYFLTQTYDCTKTKNCKKGNRDLGICTLCMNNYYLDYQDGKCKSNLEDNDFKYCQMAEDDVCTKCIEGTYLSKDFKCSYTPFCSEVEDGICTLCDKNYYLGLDNKCTDVKHCIYSNGECIECEGDYYFDRNNRTCKIGENELLHCKIGVEGYNCDICKTNFYLNKTDLLCYSNLKKNKFYKCAVTDNKAEICAECENGYYLGIKDNLCTTVEGCEISENATRCSKCDSDFYCLDKKTGKCELNYEIEKEEQKIYYKCNETNEEGTKCEKCVDDDVKYTINKKGICIDDKHCEEEEDGICQRCSNELFDSYCLNNDFGCIYSVYQNCLECNDNFNLNRCTKCYDGYELNKYNICIKKDN